MRKLPFLNGIRAFEAAARAESFAKAAGELHVTPAAISRMVQLLEQRLGVPLFERKANRLTLTAAGPRLSDRPDAGLRSARQSDGAGHRDGGLACADCRRRTDLRDALAHPAAGAISETGAGHRGALRHRRRDVALQRRMDLRHPARRRRLAGLRGGATVRRRLHAGLLAGDGQAAEDAGRFARRDAAARRACGGRMAALVQERRSCRKFA